MEWFTTLALAMGVSWVSGLRLYATVATLGLLGRLELAQLPGTLEILQNEWVIGVAATMFVGEFIADKVPWFDSFWDALHGFIRIPAGAVLASMAFGNYHPAVQVCAFLIGGALATSSHGAKSVVRVGANHSPEPFSNIGLSLVEDVVSAGSLASVVFLPFFGLGLIVLAAFGCVWLIVKAGGAIKSIWTRRRPTTA